MVNEPAGRATIAVIGSVVDFLTRPANRVCWPVPTKSPCRFDELAARPAKWRGAGPYARFRQPHTKPIWTVPGAAQKIQQDAAGAEIRRSRPYMGITPEPLELATATEYRKERRLTVGHAPLARPAIRHPAHSSGLNPGGHDRYRQMSVMMPDKFRTWRCDAAASNRAIFAKGISVRHSGG